MDQYPTFWDYEKREGIQNCGEELFLYEASKRWPYFCMYLSGILFKAWTLIGHLHIVRYGIWDKTYQAVLLVGVDWKGPAACSEQLNNAVVGGTRR